MADRHAVTRPAAGCPEATRGGRSAARPAPEAGRGRSCSASSTFPRTQRRGSVPSPQPPGPVPESGRSWIEDCGRGKCEEPDELALAIARPLRGSSDQKGRSNGSVLEMQKALPPLVGSEARKCLFAGKTHEVDLVWQLDRARDHIRARGAKPQKKLAPVLVDERERDRFELVEDALLAGVQVHELGNEHHATSV